MFTKRWLTLLLLVITATVISGTKITDIDYDQQIIYYKCGNIEYSCTYKCTPCKSCGKKGFTPENNCPSDLEMVSDPCEKMGNSTVSSLSGAFMTCYFDSEESSSGGGGCGPCGASGGSQGIQQLSHKRHFNSRSSHKISDMGLGQASNLDMRLVLSEESDGSLTIYQELPDVDFAPMYLDGRRGDVRDGIFHGSQQNSTVEMHLLDASKNNVVLNFADAAYIRFVDFKFTTYEYEVIELPSGDFGGRLISIKNLNEYGIDIDYHYDYADAVGTDLNLQWQRKTATDSSKRTFSYAYNTTPIGGEYVISSVTLPNGKTVQYEYTGDYLSKVTYPDNSFAEYKYEVDSKGNTVFEARESTGLFKKVSMTSSSALISTHTGQKLWNQNSMGTGKVTVNGEVTFAYIQNPGTDNYAKIYTGEGQMKFRHIDRQVRFYEEDFTVTKDANDDIVYNGISGTQESNYMDRNYTGPNGVEFPSQVTDTNGLTYKYTYDKLNRLTFKSYPDGTFEAWSYSSLNLTTRHRDRLGRVTLSAYDSRGNITSREVGLMDPYTGDASGYNHKYWATGNLTQIIGASANQSSKGNAGKAIDSNTNGQFNMYSVTNTNNEAQPWWKVNLVRSSLINEVKIYNRKENPERLADFTVKLFDGATEVYSQTILDPVESEGVVTITPPAGTNADSVQVQLNGTNVLSLAEVEVFGSDSVVDAQQPGSDDHTLEYAEYKYEYYPSTHANKHLLRYTFDANNNRTEYKYNSDNLLVEINEPVDDPNSTAYHLQKSMTYTNGLLSSVTVPYTDTVSRTTSFEYDDRERLVKTTYNDGSTELVIYGETTVESVEITSNQADLVVKRKDRNGNVTKYEYDNAGRLVKKIAAYSTMEADGTGEQLTNDTNLESLTEMFYLDGQTVPYRTEVNGDATEYFYDYRLRNVETHRYADSTSKLITKNYFHKNLLLWTEDPYGRRTYNSYRVTGSNESDAALTRTVTETIPGAINLSNGWFSEVDDLPRILDNNASYLVTSYTLDDEGQITHETDPKGIVSNTEYDSRGRIIKQTNDYGVDKLNQTSETDYDLNSNVIEIRNPRSLLSSGSVNDVITMTYTRRNLLLSRTVGKGSPVEETESFTYYYDRRSETHTDFRGKVSHTEWHNCCGRFQAGIDQDGHARVSTTDFYGNETHTAVLKNYVTADMGSDPDVQSLHDYTDSKTLQEVTTRFDARHRPTFRTVWLDTLGNVQANDVLIAGESGVAEEGLTSKTIYFDEATGHAELAPLLSKLTAENITFDANADGSGVLQINPEGEVSVSIQDGAGRTVASGMYDKTAYAGGAYTLLTWQTVKYDNLLASGFLETVTKSAEGLVNKVHSDGAGRRIKTVDADGKEAKSEYDANSNLVHFRDANGVGQDCEFDNLNRDIKCTDTYGDITERKYDLNNNVIKTIDAKGQIFLMEYDARNRRINYWDRLVTESYDIDNLPPITDATQYKYDENSNLKEIIDSIGKKTVYTYNDRNLQIGVLYADGKSTSCSYDALRRKDLCIDQNGDSVDYIYDLASRLEYRKYYLGASTLESTDTFTYDKASRIKTAAKGRYNNTITFEYDGIGRKKTEKMTLALPDSPNWLTAASFTTTYQKYDKDNRLEEVLYPTVGYTAQNKLTKTYTDRNQLETLTFDAKPIINLFEYDDGMRETKRIFGNGLESIRVYRSQTDGTTIKKDNLLSSITVTGRGDLSFAYQYDKNKNLLEETSTGSVMSVYDWETRVDSNDNGYDEIDRITNWKRTAVGSTDNQTWNLDRIGNWDTTSGSLGGNEFNQTRDHNDVHELTDINGASLSYDDKGNLTSIPGAPLSSAALTWDIDNHLASYEKDGFTTTFTYDALGRRLEKLNPAKNTLFISGGKQVIEEYESVGTGTYTLARSYVYGSYIDDVVAKIEAGINPTVLFYHSDRQFNVRGLSDDSVNPVIKELYAYTPYGKQIVLDSTGTVLAGSNENNNYGFTGRYLDHETGLWYFRARYFNTEMGRFTSRDPLGYSDGLSLYNGYFAENFAKDPSGLFFGQWNKHHWFYTRHLDVWKKCKLKHNRFTSLMPKTLHVYFHRNLDSQVDGLVQVFKPFIMQRGLFRQIACCYLTRGIAQISLTAWNTVMLTSLWDKHATVWGFPIKRYPFAVSQYSNYKKKDPQKTMEFIGLSLQKCECGGTPQTQTSPAADGYPSSPPIPVGTRNPPKPSPTILERLMRLPKAFSPLFFPRIDWDRYNDNSYDGGLS